MAMSTCSSIGNISLSGGGMENLPSQSPFRRKDTSSSCSGSSTSSSRRSISTSSSSSSGSSNGSSSSSSGGSRRSSSSRCNSGSSSHFQTRLKGITSNLLLSAVAVGLTLSSSTSDAFRLPAASSLARLLHSKPPATRRHTPAAWGHHEGAAILFAGRRQTTTELYSTAAAGAMPSPEGGREGGAAATPMKRDEDLPQLDSILNKRIKIGKKFLTPIGVYILVCVFVWVALFYPPLFLAAALSLLTDGGKQMRPVDWIVHWWAHVTMRFIGYVPRVEGTENLPPPGETVMYVPNHTSFLDILTLSGFIKRPFKYISKIEILRIPLIGWAMRLSKHIAIRRVSRTSQIEMVQNAIKHLKNGNSLVTFAEGTRSKDGRLNAFKKGAFRIAKEAGVRIIPISICNLHKWMPAGALVPLGVPTDVVIRIHPPVETKDRNENLVWREVFETVNQGLPEYQRHQEAPAPASSA